MSHEVETMAYTNEVPWHGLGVRVDKAPTVKAMLKLAKLDWNVSKQPLGVLNGPEFPEDEGRYHFAGNDRVVKGFYALQRDSDKSILDVVGQAYTPAQNADVFEFFTDFVEKGDATMETAGSLRGGRYVWGLANLGASFKLKGKDEVKGYLLVGAPHEQGRSVIIKVTSVRVVCNNTLTLALAKAGLAPEFRHAHRSGFTPVTIKKARETLGVAREQFDEFKANAEALQKKRMSKQDALDVLAPIFAPKLRVKELNLDKLPPKLADIFDALVKAPGAQPDTAWGVLNAVTYYADHMASKTTDKRLANAWFGKTAGQKEKVLDALLRA